MKKISIMNRVVLSLAARVAGAKWKLPLAAACLAGALAGQTVNASPYASSLTNIGGVISFRLNESASAVAVIFTNLAGTTVISNLGPKTVGLTVTNLFVPGHYTISVTNNGSPGYVSGLPIQISNDNTNGTAATGGISTNTLKFNAPRGVAVNVNPASTNFGRIYVANASAGTATRSVGDGIYILNADYSDAVGQGTNARTAGLTAFTNAASVASEEDNRSPWKLEVGEDSQLYIADFSTNNGCIYVTDPSVTTGTNVLVGFGAASFGTPEASANHGRIGSSVIAKGSLGAGNLVLYAIDSDTAGTDGRKNHIMKYNIGAGPLPFSLFFTNITSVTNYDIDLVTILSIDYTTNIVSGITNVEAASSAILLDIAGVTVDLANGPDGKFYMLQNRSDGNEGGIFVVDPANDTGDKGFSAAGDGLWDEIYDSRADSIANYGSGTTDLLKLSRAVKVSPDGKYMAIIRDDNQLWIIQMTNGLPDLSTRKLMTNNIATTIGRDVAFDAANNLYEVSSGQALMRVFSPGYRTIAQTSSKGTFVFTNILPANTVSVVGVNTNAAEPSSNGQFQFTRIGDISQALAVNYTIAGTATRGVDYQTNGFIVNFPTNAISTSNALINGTITFAAGASSTNVDIVVINDTLGEATETVIFTLVATTNYISGGTTAATVFIADDGDPAVVSVSTIGAGSYELLSARPAKFAVSILAVPAGDVVATINLTGTAVSGVDYVEPSTFTVTLVNGILSTNFTITPIDNANVSSNKTIIATVGPSVNYNVGTATTNILRNDDLTSGPTLFFDDFDSDHSANWQVQVKDGDNSANIFFDYSTIGIPSAPHSVGGTTRGIRLKAHEALVSAQNGVSVSPKGQNFSTAGDYRLRFDMWINFGFDFNGSTEMFLAGVGASEANLNCPFGTPRLAVYFGATGEGGQGASGDYRVITNTTSLATGGIVTVAAPSGSRDNVDSYYNEFGDTGIPSAQAALFPTPQAANSITPRGCLGMMWHDVIITKTATNVTWDIDGLRMITIDTTLINSAMSTNIFLGYYDLNTGSIASVPNLTFGLVDNVRVEQVYNTNALLSSLVVTPATLSPAFTSGNTSYAATNAYASNPVTVTATAADSNARLQLSLNGGTYGPLTNGVTSLAQTLNLVPAVNTLAVRVISQDGSKTNTYNTTVKLLPSQTIPVLTNSFNGSTIAFSWAADHKGYRLLSQTNSLSTGLGNNWATVPGSDLTNSVTIPLNPANPSVFYKLIYP